MTSRRHLPRAQQVYHALLEDIFTGRRPAGSGVKEEAVSHELGISRTPVREALVMLHRDGLVDRIPRRGCFVRSFSAREVADLFECRIWVECQALRTGFDRIPRKELEALAARLREAGEDREEAVEADTRLHGLIIASCPNAHWRALAGDLLKRTYPHRVFRSQGVEEMSAILRERLDIIQAILAGNRGEAESLLAAHIGRGRDLFHGSGEASDA